MANKYCHVCRAASPGTHDYCPRCGEELHAEPPGPAAGELDGRVVGDYVLEREIQGGGRGLLHRGRHLREERAVLVRSFRPRKAFERGAIRQMQREVAVAGRLTHPGILRVYELVEGEGNWFHLVMEHVEADPLDVVLRELGALEQQLALEIAAQVLAALDIAHAQGVVHRNLTPASILLVKGASPGAFVKLIEFGLSKRAEDDPEVDTTQIVEHELLRGGPLYLAPEALRGDPTDHRTDLYAVVASLYHMLTGVVPFADAEAQRFVERVLREAPIPLERARPGYPFLVGLERVVVRGLEKQPARRSPTAAALAGELRALREPSFSLARALACTFVSAALVYACFGPRRVREADGEPSTRWWFSREDERAAEVVRLESTGVVQWALGLAGFQSPVVAAPEVPIRLAEPSPVPVDARWEAYCRRVGDNRPKEPLLAAMAEIPSGRYAPLPDDDEPRESVEVERFYIDRHEVSRAQFAAFAADLAREFPDVPPPGADAPRPTEPGAANLPATHVSWDEARLFALWAGKALPNTAEWEAAVRGRRGAAWPWGDAPDPARVCCRERGATGPVPVGEDSMPPGATTEGVLHLVGNVREWLEDPWPGLAGHRAIKGGSFLSQRRELRPGYRDAHHAAQPALDLGFRCVYRPRKESR